MSSTRTELEKMLAGELYDPFDAELERLRGRSRAFQRRYNLETAYEDVAGRRALLGEWLGAMGAEATIEPPFRCDYGR